MQARYQPWWLPTVIVLLILLLIGSWAYFALSSGSAARDDKKIVLNNTKVYEWDLVTSWAKRFPGLGLGPENFSRMVNEMSNGRLKINVHGANTIVPPLGVFDAVSSGSVEMGHSAAYYWKGKIPAAPFFTSVPFGMNATEMNAWLHYGGGMELWREIYAPYDLIPFAGGNTGVQMGGWFNREIRTIDDIKGLKMRIPGFGGDVFTRSGGTAVTIPGVELYNALQTGVIDATEWVGPYNDLAIGFYQIADYYYYPGWHESGPTLEFVVNKQAFESLPEDLQAIIETATRAVNADMLDEYQARSAIALQELVDVYEVDIRPYPESVLQTFKANTFAIYAEFAEQDPQFKKIADHYFKFMDKARAYGEISEQAYYDIR
jgi:TRAP-type mannitol/chloroaromatic compound transport system substrate-binding protein